MIKYISQKLSQNYAKLAESSGDKYIQVLCEIESSLFVVTELGKTISSGELSELFEIIELT